MGGWGRGVRRLAPAALRPCCGGTARVHEAKPKPLSAPRPRPPTPTPLSLPLSLSPSQSAEFQRWLCTSMLTHANFRAMDWMGGDQRLCRDPRERPVFLSLLPPSSLRLSPSFLPPSPSVPPKNTSPPPRPPTLPTYTPSVPPSLYTLQSLCGRLVCRVQRLPAPRAWSGSIPGTSQQGHRTTACQTQRIQVTCPQATHVSGPSRGLAQTPELLPVKLAPWQVELANLNAGH
jgi:hypothetical protein